MTQEEKQLLLKDLCARLPYHPYIWYKTENGYEDYCMGNIGHCASIYDKYWLDFKPYLRPMSSMTKEELSFYNNYLITPGITILEENLSEYLDWMHSHYLDYRGLIEKGLALKAPEGMYND